MISNLATCISQYSRRTGTIREISALPNTTTDTTNMSRRYISIPQVALNSGHGNLYLKEVRIWYYNVASNLSLVIPGNTQWSPVINSNLQEWHQ